MRSCLTWLPFTLLLALGCNPVVTFGGDPGAGSGGEGGESTASGPATPPDPPAIQADHIAAPIGDVLKIALGNYLETCGPNAFDHYPENATPCLPDPTWRVRLNIPLAQITVGAVFPFPDISDGWQVSEIDPGVPYDPKYGCGGGGGSYWEGTAEVLSITATTLQLRLAGTSPFISPIGGNADGDYDVTLCGPVGSPPQVVKNAIATTSAQALTLVATNLPNTCASPAPVTNGCTAEIDSLTIALPPAMQAVGTYPLTNLATSSSSGADAYGNCSSGIGSYWNGTIEIVSIDPSQIVFNLAGTDQHFLAPGNADGNYVAPRCN